MDCHDSLDVAFKFTGRDLTAVQAPARSESDNSGVRSRQQNIAWQLCNYMYLDAALVLCVKRHDLAQRR